MGYKVPAVHRAYTYSTDCDCKHNHFAQSSQCKRASRDTHKAISSWVVSSRAPLDDFYAELGVRDASGTPRLRVPLRVAEEALA